MKRTYELTFIGGALGEFPRYRRTHRTLASAEAAAHQVWRALDIEPSEVAVDPSHRGPSSRTAAHDAIVFGPGCGPEGKRLQSGR
jgi:hypothetical protein